MPREVTVQEYAKEIGLTKEGARKRLDQMIKDGKATKKQKTEGKRVAPGKISSYSLVPSIKKFMVYTLLD